MASKVDITPEDILGGLDAVISVFVPNPTFTSQAKVKLSGKIEGDAIYSALVKEFNKFINGMSDEQKKILGEKIVDNAKIRTAAEVAKITKKKSIRKRDNILDLPSNLKDCSCAGVDPENAELFICEGLSAAGSVTAARDAKHQGVLPIRGKTLNVLKLDMGNKEHRKRLDNNQEINDIIKALGAGVGEHFDIEKTRYGRVVIAVDSDTDGKNIAVLLLGVFWKLFRPMVEDGHIYQAVSPFYEFSYNHKGHEHNEYAINERERIEIEKRLKAKNIKYEMSRAKGLGELNADVFSEVVMNPNNRTLIQVTVDDAKEAAEMLDLAIGMRPADDRKEWMFEHAEEVIPDLGLYT